LTYIVKLTKKALAEAEAYAQYILDQSNDNMASNKWWDGFLDPMFSLEALPGRCPLLPEGRYLRVEVRYLLYESHRLIFQIERGEVQILRVYHASKKPLTKTALRKTMHRRSAS